MKWKRITEEKPILGQRVVIYEDGMILSATYIIHPSFKSPKGSNIHVDEYFLFDTCFFDTGKCDDRFGRNLRNNQLLYGYWAPIDDFELPKPKED